jgi:hypothetical protein
MKSNNIKRYCQPLATVAFLVILLIHFGAFAQYVPYRSYQPRQKQQQPTTKIKQQGIQEDDEDEHKYLSPYQRYTHFKLSAGYGVATPQAGLTEYIKAPASRNWAITGEVVFKKGFSVGLQIGYINFAERIARQLYGATGTNISAVQTRTLAATPIHVVSKIFLLGASSPIRPYLQGSFGATMLNYVNYWGTLDDGNNETKLGTTLGGGISWTPNPQSGFGIELKALYHQAPFQYGYMTKFVAVDASLGISYRWY